jgi:hypothetical protein
MFAPVRQAYRPAAIDRDVCAAVTRGLGTNRPASHCFQTRNKAAPMVTYNEMMIEEIVEDDSLTTEQKIEKLRAIESEARGLQRAASESAMNADNGWENSLRMVRKALNRLGAADQKKGAASL